MIQLDKPISKKFYNLSVKNTTTSEIPVRFNASLNIPFIQKPSDWTASVVRFVVPNFSTPIFTFQDATYYFTLNYYNKSVTLPIVFESRNLADATDRKVYEIQHLIDMMNTTLVSCWTALNALGALPTTDKPYFIYNVETSLISLIANLTYYVSTIAHPINIYCNNTCFKFLQGLPVTYTGASTYEYQLLVRNAFNNTYNTNYFQMQQNSSSFSSTTDFDRVVITTDLPIQAEYIGSSVSLPIIQDFCPNEITSQNFHENIVYNAIFPYRTAKMTSDVAFYSINFNFYWADVNGTLTEMLLPVKSSANIKVMFTRDY